MYRRSKFNNLLLEIRREMSAEADHDVDLFAEMVRSGSTSVMSTNRKETRDTDTGGKCDDELALITRTADLPKR